MNSSASRQPVTTCTVHTLRTARDAARHCEQVFTGFVDFAFDTEDEGTRLTSRAVATDHFRLSTTMSSGHRITLNETAGCTVIVPIRGEVRITSDGLEQVAGTGQGIIALPGRRTTEISRDYLGITSLIPDINPGQDDVLTRPSVQLIAFMRYLADAFDTSPALTSDTQAHAAMSELIKQLVRQSASEPYRLPGTASHTTEHHVRRAEDWLAACAGEPGSVADMARAVGVTVRTLQVAFRRHRDCTPHQVIARHRLERIHLELAHAAPGASVTSVAMENGVLHLGRFAASYRQIFGENPSDTLARSRNR